MECSFNNVATAVHLVLGEFNNQDGILGSQTDEHYQADLEIGVVLQSTDRNTGISTQYSDGQRDEHSDRHAPALVQSSQEEEDEEEYQSQDKSGLSPGLFFLIRQATPFYPDIVGQVVASNTLQQFHHLSGASTIGSRTTNNRSIEHIKSLDASRTGSIFRRSERRKRNHVAIATTYEIKTDIVAMLTIRSFSLQIDTIDAVEHIKVVHINRTRISFHRRENISHRHA